MEDNAHTSRQPSGTNQDQGEAIEVDCDTCVMRATAACDDCLVTYICNREPDEAVIVTIDELRSMRMLSEAGLVPSLKHEPAHPPVSELAPRAATMER